MSKKSTFWSDLEKERKLSILLDSYYKKHLKQYSFERIDTITKQIEGIDLILTHKRSGKTFLVDEKAQLDYVNKRLPTFAFELKYYKNGSPKQGWLFDRKKKTDFYALVTSIFSDETNFTQCKITFVNRNKLIGLLAEKGITEDYLKNSIRTYAEKESKLNIELLHPKKEGYLYFSTQNKVEKPINLVLKLDFLIETGVATQLV